MQSSNDYSFATNTQQTQPLTQFRNILLIAGVGILAAMIIDGEFGQWLQYLSDHNFGLAAGDLVSEQTIVTP